MKICIIYHSYSGVTRGVAEKLRDACGGDLIEVKSRRTYNKLTVYAVGSMRARKEEYDPIDPESIDVSSCDIIVIGTPVWAWKATPAANAAVAALKGGEGKPAFLFATCGGQAGDALQILGKALAAKNIGVAGEFVFTRKDVEDPQKLSEFFKIVRAAGRGG